MTAVRLGPDHDLAKRLSTLEQKVQQLSTRDLLQNASIGAGGLSVNSGGAITINGGGSMSVNGGGNIDITGGSINVSNGSVAITGAGEVTVDGIKLTSVIPGSVGGSTSNFALTTTSTPVLTLNLTVPPGYSTVLIMSVCQVALFPSSSGFVYASTNINNGSAAESDATSIANNAISLTPAAIDTLTLSGQTTIPVSVNVRASVAMTASTSNVATVNAIAIFVQ